MGDKRAYFEKRIVSITESHGQKVLKLESNHTWAMREGWSVD